MSIREEILEFMRDGPKTAKEMLTLSYSRNTIQGYLKLMVKGGEIYKHGSGGTAYFTLDNVPKAFPNKKKKAEAITLPDLPPIMIAWLGYTDKEPDPDAGEFIHGGQW